MQWNLLHRALLLKRSTYQASGDSFGNFWWHPFLLSIVFSKISLCYAAACFRCEADGSYQYIHGQVYFQVGRAPRVRLQADFPWLYRDLYTERLQSNSPGRFHSVQPRGYRCLLKLKSTMLCNYSWSPRWWSKSIEQEIFTVTVMFTIGFDRNSSWTKLKGV